MRDYRTELKDKKLTRDLRAEANYKLRLLRDELAACKHDEAYQIMPMYPRAAARLASMEYARKLAKNQAIQTESQAMVRCIKCRVVLEIFQPETPKKRSRS